MVKKIHNMVEYELNTDPQTRSSDRTLIKKVYADFYGVNGASFEDVMDDTKLPSFETITRCRRRLQEENEELRAVQVVENERIAVQEEWLNYAKGEY